MARSATRRSRSGGATRACARGGASRAAKARCGSPAAVAGGDGVALLDSRRGRGERFSRVGSVERVRASCAPRSLSARARGGLVARRASTRAAVAHACAATARAPRAPPRRRGAALRAGRRRRASSAAAPRETKACRELVARARDGVLLATRGRARAARSTSVARRVPRRISLASPVEATSASGYAAARAEHGGRRAIARRSPAAVSPTARALLRLGDRPRLTRRRAALRTPTRRRRTAPRAARRGRRAPPSLPQGPERVGLGRSRAKIDAARVSRRVDARGRRVRRGGRVAAAADAASERACAEAARASSRRGQGGDRAPARDRARGARGQARTRRAQLRRSDDLAPVARAHAGERSSASARAPRLDRRAAAEGARGWTSPRAAALPPPSALARVAATMRRGGDRAAEAALEAPARRDERGARSRSRAHRRRRARAPTAARADAARAAIDRGGADAAASPTIAVTRDRGAG